MNKSVIVGIVVAVVVIIVIVIVVVLSSKKKGIGAGFANAFVIENRSNDTITGTLETGSFLCANQNFSVGPKERIRHTTNCDFVKFYMKTPAWIVKDIEGHDEHGNVGYWKRAVIEGSNGQYNVTMVNSP